MNVKLVSVTQPQVSTPDRAPMSAEDIIAYCARVSNPKNQLNTKTAPKLIAFLIKPIASSILLGQSKISFPARNAFNSISPGLL